MLLSGTVIAVSSSIGFFLGVATIASGTTLIRRTLRPAA
jgi:hypothetical protein